MSGILLPINVNEACCSRLPWKISESAHDIWQASKRAREKKLARERINQKKSSAVNTRRLNESYENKNI